MFEIMQVADKKGSRNSITATIYREAAGLRIVPEAPSGKSGQLRQMQESFMLQMVKDECYSLAAMKKRLQQLQLAPLAEDDLRLQFAAVEMKLPAGRIVNRQKRRELLQLAFQMLCREMAGHWKGIYPFGDATNPAMMVFLVIMKQGPKHARKSQLFVEELQRNIASCLKLECVTGIGEEVKGLKRRKNGFASCMLSWSRNAVSKDRNMPELTQTFTPEMERNLTQAIENFDAGALSHQLDAMFSSHEEAPLSYCTLLALRLLLLLHSIARKFEPRGSALQKYLWNCQKTIAGEQSREGIRRQIEELVRLVMEEVKKIRCSSGPQMAEAVRKYVEENFYYELTFSTLADKFHLQESELPGLFKQHVGVAFSNYVTKLRMAKAEQLLQENELRLADISMLAGYSSTSHFSASFKKYSGTCPKDYRKRYWERHAQE
ncbi:helix-turn-helix transcriptional regulator [Paenibacillus sp. BAC0078]